MGVSNVEGGGESCLGARICFCNIVQITSSKKTLIKPVLEVRRGGIFMKLSTDWNA